MNSRQGLHGGPGQEKLKGKKRDLFTPRGEKTWGMQKLEKGGGLSHWESPKKGRHLHYYGTGHKREGGGGAKDP